MDLNSSYKIHHAYYCRIIVSIVIIFAQISCASLRTDKVSRNNSFSYVPGLPHISMSSSGFYDKDNNIYINIVTEIVPSSLISSSDKSTKSIECEILYEITDQSTDKSVGKFSSTEKFSYPISKSPSHLKNYLVIKDLKVPKAGSYEVTVNVIDKKSDKTSVANDEVIIPDTLTDELGLSGTTFSALDSSRLDSGYIPITTYEVTKNFDEIRFENLITGNNLGNPLSVEVQVLKYRSDTDVTARMSSPDFTISTLKQNGIEYNKSEVIYSQKRKLNKEDNLITYSVGIPTPEIGNYRYEINIINENTDNSLTKAFDFGVKRAGFPYIRNPRQMAEPLFYLMNDKEYDRLLSIENEDSLKKEIDSFWLKHIQDTSKAKEVIDLYYTRVEEANKYFSSYKEGWKTDLGMIYILFGAPNYSYHRFNEIHWSYSVDRYTSRYNYYFKKERRKSRVFPFVLYILDRSKSQLKENEYIVLEDWLSGNVVN